MTHSRRRFATSLVAAAFALSCTPYTAVRRPGIAAEARNLGDFEPCRGRQPDCPLYATLCGESWERYRTAKEDGAEEFYVGVIEVADDGHLRSIEQERLVLSKIRDLATKPRAEDGEPQGAILVTFVHGWHHGADPCDSNLTCFRQVLASLSRDRSRPVIGLYLGWRGESIGVPFLNYLTFYNRKRAAHGVGAHGARQALEQLRDLYCEINLCDSPAERRYRLTMITVGHSFGGAVVYSTIENLMVREEGPRHVVGVTANGAKELRQGFGDLTILVNPAFEARRYQPFHDDLAAPSSYEREQLPALLTISSRADKANRYIFPLGRFINPRRIFYRTDRGVTALGQRERELTHELRTDETGPSDGVDIEDCTCGSVKEEFEKQARAAAQRQDAPVKNLWSDRFGAVVIEPRNPKGPARIPFLVARTTNSIIGDHNDIFNDRFVTFLREYILHFVLTQKKQAAARGKA